MPHYHTNKAPLVSVVTSFFGDYCDFRHLCLASLVNQQFQDFELIFIFDGPSPLRKQLLRDLHESGLNYHILENEKNLGSLESRMRASQKACGRYITFLDHDDTYEANFLYELYNTAVSTSSDIVECPLLQYEPNKQPFLFRRFQCDERRLGDEVLRKYCEGYSHNNVFNKLIRKSLWDTACEELSSDLPNVYISFFEDLVFTLNLYKNCATYTSTCRTHYNYIQREKSAVNPTSVDSIAHTLRQLRTVLQYIDHKFSSIVSPAHIRQLHQRETLWALMRLECKLTQAKRRGLLTQARYFLCRLQISYLRFKYSRRHDLHSDYATEG